MPNLNQIKWQIKSVKNLKKITRALEVVSTVKLQKTKNKAEALKTYLLDLLFILNSIWVKSDIFWWDNVKWERELVIIMTSDKWLCWALNSKLLREVLNNYSDKKNNTDFFVIWKKWFEFLGRYKFNVVWNISVPDSFSDEDLLPLFEYLNKSMDNSTYSSIKVHFNYFKNSLVQLPTSLNIFPLNKENFDEFLKSVDITYSKKADFRWRDIIIEPDMEVLLKEIKRQIRNYFIMSALVQNKTWEFASRMIAMKSAKDNSSSKINSLTLTLNKARQWAITQEISEIVWAKAALE